MEATMPRPWRWLLFIVGAAAGAGLMLWLLTGR